MFVQDSSGKHAKNKFACMPHGGGNGPVRDVGVKEFFTADQFVGQAAESAAKHNRHTRPQLGAGFDKCFGVLEHRRISHPRLASYHDTSSNHTSMPAMQADMKFAIEPTATAFNPRRARSGFRLGAMAPIPPI